MREFDVARAKIVLKNLKSTTRGQVPMLSMNADPAQEVEPPIYRQCVANRAGLFRYGIELATQALESESQEIALFPLPLVNGQVLNVKVLLLDDPPLPPKPSTFERLLPILFGTYVALVFVLSVIGLITCFKAFRSWLL